MYFDKGNNSRILIEFVLQTGQKMSYTIGCLVNFELTVFKVRVDLSIGSEGVRIIYKLKLN
jgi:hypothetical protein